MLLLVLAAALACWLGVSSLTVHLEACLSTGVSDNCSVQPLGTGAKIIGSGALALSICCLAVGGWLARPLVVRHAEA